MKNDYFVPLSRVQRVREWWANARFTTRLAVVLAVPAGLVTGGSLLAQDACSDTCLVIDDEVHIQSLADIYEVEQFMLQAIPVDKEVECAGIACTLGQEQFIVYEKPAEAILTLRWVSGAVFMDSLTLESPTLAEEDRFVVQEMMHIYPEMIPRGTAGVGDVHAALVDAGFLRPATALREVALSGLLPEMLLRFAARGINPDEVTLQLAVSAEIADTPIAEPTVIE